MLRIERCVGYFRLAVGSGIISYLSLCSLNFHNDLIIIVSVVVVVFFFLCVWS